MSGDLVLLTGATGHVGFQVLKTALKQGYKIRAAVRSQAKAENIRSNPVYKSLNKDSDVEFVVVPDFLVQGAFDEAVKDVKYIIHVASPIPSGAPEDVDPEEFYIKPAVNATLGVFESAAKSPSVKRVVVTSSVVAIIPAEYLVMKDTPSDVVINAESRIPFAKGPYPASFLAYAASKTAALEEAEKWLKSRKPQFDAIHIHPSFIFGKDDLVQDQEAFMNGTNAIPTALALGKAPGNLENTGFLITSVDSVARMHVGALDPKIEGNQSFISSTTGEGTWKEISDVVARNFPEQVSSGVFPNNSSINTLKTKVDISKTEKAFGFKPYDTEGSITAVLKHFLEITGQ